jgi:hypothetical protein
MLAKAEKLELLMMPRRGELGACRQNILLLLLRA